MLTVGIVGQRAQQILQLARRDGDRLVLLAGELAVRGDLHFEIGGGDEQAAILLFEQNVGEYRQRMSAFDDSGYGLQRFEQRVSGCLF